MGKPKKQQENGHQRKPSDSIHAPTAEGRQRLAELGRKRWTDPAYRAMMLEKMAAARKLKLTKKG